MNRLEYTPIPAGRYTGATLKQSPKERGVLVADGETDLVNRLVRRFQKVLGLLDAKVLHVVDECQPRGLLEAPFQRTLWNLRMPDDAGHHTRLSEVLPEPRLAAAHHG